MCRGIEVAAASNVQCARPGLLSVLAAAKAGFRHVGMPGLLDFLLGRHLPVARHSSRAWALCSSLAAACASGEAATLLPAPNVGAPSCCSPAAPLPVCTGGTGTAGSTKTSGLSASMFSVLSRASCFVEGGKRGKQVGLNQTSQTLGWPCLVAFPCSATWC